MIIKFIQKIFAHKAQQVLDGCQLLSLLWLYAQPHLEMTVPDTWVKWLTCSLFGWKTEAQSREEDIPHWAWQTKLPSPSPPCSSSPPGSTELCTIVQVPGLAWTCLPDFLGAATSPVSPGCQATQPPFPCIPALYKYAVSQRDGGWNSFWGKINHNDKLSYSCKPSACYPWLCRTQTVRIWVTELAHQRHHQGCSPAHLAGAFVSSSQPRAGQSAASLWQRPFLTHGPLHAVF